MPQLQGIECLAKPPFRSFHPSFCASSLFITWKGAGAIGQGSFFMGACGAFNFSTLGMAPLSPSPGIHPELAGTVSDLSDLELYAPHVCVCVCMSHDLTWIEFCLNSMEHSTCAFGHPQLELENLINPSAAFLGTRPERSKGSI